MGKSLLSVGVIGAVGEFERGDIVNVLDTDGAHIARGIANYSSTEISRIAGVKSDEIEKILGHASDEDVIHADNIALG